MRDVMQLFLRHLCVSPGHLFKSGRRGAAIPFWVGELPERGFLQFLTEAFNVHSIAYYDLSLIVAIS